MSNPNIDPIFEMGEKNPFSQFFIGQSYLKMLTTQGVPVANVTFEPSCRKMEYSL